MISAKNMDGQNSNANVDTLNALLVEKDSSLSILNSDVAKMRETAEKCDALQAELDSLRGSFAEKDRAIDAITEELERSTHGEILFL